jgi:8-oxo-dGTP pyrophosphatase MutT (NUDIX family)
LSKPVLIKDAVVTKAPPPDSGKPAGLDAMPAHVDLSSDEFFRRAENRLSFNVPSSLTDASIIPQTDDEGMNRVLEIISKEKPIRPAAVLVPIIAREEPTVLLTQRATHLNDHAGQVAFPGGKIDATDASPLAAALREAHEEVGLEGKFIEPIGYMDVYATPFGFRILPLVARVKPGFELRVNKDEVDDVFEVPLAFLMNPANHFQKTREFRDITRSFYEMPYGDRYVWGVTAGILRTLYQRIFIP